jgi:hypothetical protein
MSTRYAQVSGPPLKRYTVFLCGQFLGIPVTPGLPQPRCSVNAGHQPWRGTCHSQAAWERTTINACPLSAGLRVCGRRLVCPLDKSDQMSCA